MSLTETVIENLLKIRKARVWTLQDVADRCQRLDRPAISKIENRARRINLEDLEDLGEALGVDPAQLIKPLQVVVQVIDADPQPTPRTDWTSP